jgi:thiamine transporter ThiT
MQSDFDRLDPELRISRQFAIASAAFGVISLCAGIVPACGGITSILGITLGFLSLRAEKSKTAMAGIVISILGILITFMYVVIQLYFQD